MNQSKFFSVGWLNKAELLRALQFNHPTGDQGGKSTVSIKEKLKQLLSELCPYLVTAFACVNAAFVGIDLFGNEGASGLIRFFQFVCFVFALGCALFCLVQTVVHCFIHAFSRWISRMTFILRERHE